MKSESINGNKKELHQYHKKKAGSPISERYKEVLCEPIHNFLEGFFYIHASILSVLLSTRGSQAQFNLWRPGRNNDYVD